MKKTVAIVQSNYIPWKGYFDLINLADEFVILDNVQYTRRDWRNRNIIKTSNGLAWLTIPVDVKGKFNQLIRETQISDPEWARRHWQTLCHHYAKAQYFPLFRERFETMYLDRRETLLSEVNLVFLRAVCDAIGITTPIVPALDDKADADPTERLIRICRRKEATAYLSGPAARGYLDVDRFSAHGIEVCWMDYTAYPEYPQIHGPFEHGVTILDLLFNVGPESARYMKSFRPTARGFLRPEG